MLLKKIKIGNLFSALNVNNDKYYEEQYPSEQVLVNSPSGYIPIRAYVIKNNINLVEANVDGVYVVGADKHLVKVNNEWRPLDSFSHDRMGTGLAYDIAVDDPHEFTAANGIIHHNTTVAKLLCNDIGADSIYINISTESGIDTLRSTIKSFASTKSFTGGPKVVIMDEADGATPQLQAGLRGFIEEFHAHCRFILTCNYISKIIQPLREGRVMEFDFNMTDKATVEEMMPKQVKRLENILKLENVTYDVAVLERLVKENYPNMRKMITGLQKASSMYGTIDENIFRTVAVDSKLYELILNKKFTAARQFIIESNYNIDELFPSLYREMVPMISDKSIQAQVILILAQYQSWHATAIDAELNFSAAMLEIIGVL